MGVPLAESEGANSASALPFGSPPTSFLAVPGSSSADDGLMQMGSPSERDAHFAMGRLSGRANLEDVPEAAGGPPRTPSPLPLLSDGSEGKAVPMAISKA